MSSYTELHEVEGYTNLPTCQIALEIRNDRGQLEYWQETARGFNTDIELADYMQNQFEERVEANTVDNTDNPDGLIYTLVMTALGWVNWLELARDLKEGRI